MPLVVVRVTVFIRSGPGISVAFSRDIVDVIVVTGNAVVSKNVLFSSSSSRL